jgi:hypothetical protein
MRVSIDIPSVLEMVGGERGYPLDDLASLHHAGDVPGMLQDPNVFERIPLHQDNVGPLVQTTPL